MLHTPCSAASGHCYFHKWHQTLTDSSYANVTAFRRKVKNFPSLEHTRRL